MRSNDRVFAGVCGGLAEYFDFDPVMVHCLRIPDAFHGFLWSHLLLRAVDCDAGEETGVKVKR